MKEKKKKKKKRKKKKKLEVGMDVKCFAVVLHVYLMAKLDSKWSTT